jgi:hypothetical protein
MLTVGFPAAEIGCRSLEREHPLGGAMADADALSAGQRG